MSHLPRKNITPLNLLMRSRTSIIFVLTLVLFVGFSVSQQANAQKKYPDLQGEFFSDDANLVDLNTRRQISREMRNTLQDSKIHVVLAVIKKMSDYPDLDQDIKKFTEDLAEHWQIGEAKSKLGILVLFSIEDRKFFVAKTKEMSTRLTDEIKQGLMGLPVKALKQNNVSLAMKRAANVLVEMVPSFDSEKGAKNIVGGNNAGKKAVNKSNTTRRPQTQSNRKPPTRVIRQEREDNRGGGFGAGIGTLICVGFAAFMVIASLAGVGMAAGRGYGGGGYYGGGYHGGGGGFLSGMLTGSLLSGMFGGGGHHHSEHHHHHYDSGGGGYDGGGFDGGGGGFDYGADTFGGGDFDGGSMGEW